MRDKKLHAVVARSTCGSEHVQNTPGPDHLWQLRCRKNARRCGMKHMPKSNVQNTPSAGSCLEFEMSKKCTPLWDEAHFEVEMYKHHMLAPFLELQMSFHVAGARDCPMCGFFVFSTTTTTTPYYTPIHYTKITNTITPSLHSTTPHSTTHYTTLHSITLNYTSLHYTTLHSTTPH